MSADEIITLADGNLDKAIALLDLFGALPAIEKPVIEESSTQAA
jgi:hypothetical protein